MTNRQVVKGIFEGKTRFEDLIVIPVVRDDCFRLMIAKLDYDDQAVETDDGAPVVTYLDPKDFLSGRKLRRAVKRIRNGTIKAHR